MTPETLLADWRERAAKLRFGPSGPTADERDAQHVAECMAALDERPGPRVGDFVIFADGTTRRISYHWRDDAGWDGGCQTSDSGSYHLGRYGVSMSGSLCSTVPTDSLVLTAERRQGSVWVFHHDFAGAGRGVTFYPLFRVYTCDREAPR
jgi:hypothetical protein